MNGPSKKVVGEVGGSSRGDRFEELSPFIVAGAAAGVNDLTIRVMAVNGPEVVSFVVIGD